MVCKLLSSGTLAPRKHGELLTSRELGAYVKQCRERKGLTQADVAKTANMRGPQVSLLETGANVEVQFYERVARALGFRHALEMFTAGADDQMRKMLRLWRALPDDSARNDALGLMRDLIVADEAPGATTTVKPARGSGTERIRKGH